MRNPAIANFNALWSWSAETRSPFLQSHPRAISPPRLAGEKNTLEPSPPANSWNNLKANRVLGEVEVSVTYEGRTADVFLSNGHDMGISRAATLSNQLN